MGYESKIYVCDYHKDGYCETISAVDLAKMGNFFSIFTKEVYEGEYTTKNLLGKEIKLEADFHFYGMDFDDDTTKDLYGTKLKYAELDDAIEYLEDCMKNKDYYRRIPPTLAMLKSFQNHKNDWEHLIVIHYGH